MNKQNMREVMKNHLRGFSLIEKYNRGYFWAVGITIAITSLTPFITAFFSARLVDELAGAKRVEVMTERALYLIIATFILAILWGGASRWRNIKSESSWVCARRNMAEKLLGMDFADVDSQVTQDICSQIRQDEEWSGSGLMKVTEVFVETVKAVVGIASALVLTAGLFTSRVPDNAGIYTVLNHPVCTIGMGVIMLLIIVFGAFLFKKSGEYKVMWAESTRDMNRSIDAFSGLGSDQDAAMDIRMYNQQDIAAYYMEKDAFSGKQKEYNQLSRGKMGLLMAISVSAPVLLTGVTYVFVCLKAMGGAFGVGSVTLYVTSVVAVTAHIAGLMKQIAEMKNNSPFLSRLFGFLDMKSNMKQGSLDICKLPEKEYEIEYKNVSFSYPGSKEKVLSDVSVKLTPGKRIAIVGENGSGKTTFIKLLCRLYDPTDGHITLNGKDIREFGTKSYEKLFSVVFQDFKLIAQSLGENVAGSTEYDREKAKKALNDGGFGERLARMPEGLDTMLYKELSADGVDISGGEAQKIALARALYKDAPFVILDEPTAALDPIAEEEIYARFGEIVTDKTAVYISHRLSSCRFCDEIIVFKKGQIAEMGSHDELLQAEGEYAKLWNAQAQYYA